MVKQKKNDSWQGQQLWELWPGCKENKGGKKNIVRVKNKKIVVSGDTRTKGTLHFCLPSRALNKLWTNLHWLQQLPYTHTHTRRHWCCLLLQAKKGETNEGRKEEKATHRVSVATETKLSVQRPFPCFCLLHHSIELDLQRLFCATDFWCFPTCPNKRLRPNLATVSLTSLRISRCKKSLHSFYYCQSTGEVENEMKWNEMQIEMQFAA